MAYLVFDTVTKFGQRLIESFGDENGIKTETLSAFWWEGNGAIHFGLVRYENVRFGYI